MIPARSGLILEGQAQAGLHLKFNDPWSDERGPVQSHHAACRDRRHKEAGGLAGRADLGEDPVCRSGVAAAKARDADHRNV
jgi:hypothetical protein